ncbi:hypothetical protein HK097_007943 [Rhizophlyctis rosea]|uniref:Cytochrome P450 n=1 Tax=Rhizophlyctis rosea TaxID=64517 RepID=A0AAD5SAZ6_9FUNG|nr:hypothetical protein HK097_007943 [Rhizophlyctis rosea]
MAVLSTLSNLHLPSWLHITLLPSLSSNFPPSVSENITPLILSTTAAALIAYAFFGPRSKNPTVPGPYELPIVGNFLQAYPYIKNQQFQELTAQLVEKYGNIVMLKLFSRQIVITRDPDVAKRVLNPSSSDPEFTRPDNSKIFVIPYMLFALGTDDLWKRHRKFLQPAFGPSHLRFALDASNEVMDELCRIWEGQISAKPDGKLRTNARDVMTSVTMDIIGKVAFSYDFKSVLHLTSHNAPQHSIDTILKTISNRFAVPPFLWSLFDLADSSSPVKKAREENAALLKDVIRRKREGAAGTIGKDERKFDLLDRLLAENEASGSGGEGKFGDEEILGEVWGFFMAGHETTSHTLTFIILELCRNPHILTKLEDEIETVLGGRDAEVTWDGVHQLKYLEMVIKETQRLHAVVGGIGRESTRDVDVLGHRIEKGTRVNVAIRLLQRDSRYWDEPLVFKPERWENGFVPRAGTYLPFGDGVHNCIGQKMALLETKITIVKLLQKFSFTMLPNQGLSIRTSVTSGLAHGLVVDVELRK